MILYVFMYVPFVCTVSLKWIYVYVLNFCVCLCMYVCMYVCMNERYLFKWMYVYICVRISFLVCVCMYVCGIVQKKQHENAGHFPRVHGMVYDIRDGLLSELKVWMYVWVYSMYVCQYVCMYTYMSIMASFAYIQVCV